MKKSTYLTDLKNESIKKLLSLHSTNINRSFITSLNKLLDLIDRHCDEKLYVEFKKSLNYNFISNMRSLYSEWQVISKYKEKILSSIKEFKGAQWDNIYRGECSLLNQIAKISNDYDQYNPFNLDEFIFRNDFQSVPGI